MRVSHFVCHCNGLSNERCGRRGSEVLVRADVSPEIFKSVLCWAIKEVTDAVIKAKSERRGKRMHQHRARDAARASLAGGCFYRASFFLQEHPLSASDGRGDRWILLFSCTCITDDTRQVESTLCLFLPQSRHLSLPIDWLVLESIKALICQSTESDDQTLRLSWWFQLIFKTGLGNFALYDWTMRPLNQSSAFI